MPSQAATVSGADPVTTNVPHAGGRYIVRASTYRRVAGGRVLRVRRLPASDCGGDSLATARIAFLTPASLSEDRVVPRQRLTGRIHRGSLRRSLRRWRPAVRCATGLTDLPHFSRVVSLIWRRPGRRTDGRVILTAQGWQLARTGGCGLCASKPRVGASGGDRSALRVARKQVRECPRSGNGPNHTVPRKSVSGMVLFRAVSCSICKRWLSDQRLSARLFKGAADRSRTGRGEHAPELPRATRTEPTPVSTRGAPRSATRRA